MIAAQIENGVVVNILVVDSLDFMPSLVELQGGFGIGDFYNEATNTFTRAEQEENEASEE